MIFGKLPLKSCFLNDSSGFGRRTCSYLKLYLHCCLLHLGSADKLKHVWMNLPEGPLILDIP